MSGKVDTKITNEIALRGYYTIHNDKYQEKISRKIDINNKNERKSC